MSRNRLIDRAMPYIVQSPGIEITRLLVKLGLSHTSASDRRYLLKSLEESGQVSLKVVPETKSRTWCYVFPKGYEPPPPPPGCPTPVRQVQAARTIAVPQCAIAVKPPVQREQIAKAIAVESPAPSPAQGKREQMAQAIADAEAAAIQSGELQMPTLRQLCRQIGVAINWLAPSVQNSTEDLRVAYDAACQRLQRLAQDSHQYGYQSKHDRMVQAIAAAEAEALRSGRFKLPSQQQLCRQIGVEQKWLSRAKDTASLREAYEAARIRLAIAATPTKRQAELIALKAENSRLKAALDSLKRPPFTEDAAILDAAVEAIAASPTNKIQLSNPQNPMKPAISMLSEVPEPLYEGIARFIDSHRDWDHDRVVSAALALFLIQSPDTRDRAVEQLYLETQFGERP